MIIIRNFDGLCRGFSVLGTSFLTLTLNYLCLVLKYFISPQRLFTHLTTITLGQFSACPVDPWRF